MVYDSSLYGCYSAMQCTAGLPRISQRAHITLLGPLSVRKSTSFVPRTAYFQGVPYTGYCTIPAQRPGSRIWRVPDVVSAETECTEVHNTPSLLVRTRP